MNIKISFPQLGDYTIALSYLLSKCINGKVIDPLPISKKTIDLADKYAPNSVCIPFKHNLGNFIEILESGCNYIIQTNGCCKYGYYSEVQEKILKDLGYEFKVINIFKKNKITIRSMYNALKEINPKLSFISFLYYGIITFLMIKYINIINNYIRFNIGFEIKKNSFYDLKKEMLSDFKNNIGMFNLTKLFFKYKNKFKKLDINIPKDCIKIGMIGNLYSPMEIFSNYYIEKELANRKIRIKRYSNASYLLFQKKSKVKKMLKYCKNYVKYGLGENGLDNIYQTIKLINSGYDGIIHIKPFGCTPEISTIPIIKKICNDYKFPIIFLTFSNHISEEMIKKNLENFYKIIKKRKINAMMSNKKKPK